MTASLPARRNQLKSQMAVITDVSAGIIPHLDAKSPE
jgi:hypothetical protein